MLENLVVEKVVEIGNEVKRQNSHYLLVSSDYYMVNESVIIIEIVKVDFI